MIYIVIPPPLALAAIINDVVQWTKTNWTTKQQMNVNERRTVLSSWQLKSQLSGHREQYSPGGHEDTELAGYVQTRPSSSHLSFSNIKIIKYHTLTSFLFCSNGRIIKCENGELHFLNVYRMSAVMVWLKKKKKTSLRAKNQKILFQLHRLGDYLESLLSIGLIS